jgi:predicted membrane GTPase involved in stress response
MVTRRRGEMLRMETRGDRMHLEFSIPSRGIIGLRNQVLTGTAGEAVMTHRFVEFAPMRGDIDKRVNGSLIAMETGQLSPMPWTNCRTVESFLSSRAMRYTLARSWGNTLVPVTCV